MNTTSYGRVAVAVVLLAAGGVVRAEPPEAVAEEFESARILGHLYVNARTGEVARVPAAAPRLSDLFWQNEDRAGPGVALCAEGCNLALGRR